VTQQDPSSIASTPDPAPAAPPARTLDPLALGALVLGIVGFVAYPIVPSILAIVLGIRARRQPASASGPLWRAVAGVAIVLGWAGLALMLLTAVGLVAVGARSSSG
jgi:hypothetical protein